MYTSQHHVAKETVLILLRVTSPASGLYSSEIQLTIRRELINEKLSEAPERLSCESNSLLNQWQINVVLIILAPSLKLIIKSKRENYELNHSREWGTQSVICSCNDSESCCIRLLVAGVKCPSSPILTLLMRSLCFHVYPPPSR